MITRTFPSKFDALDEKWRSCALCGQYKVTTHTYTGTSQVDEIDASTKKVVTFEAATTLVTDETAETIAVGDMFILEEDYATEGGTGLTSWREIESIDSETQLTLVTAYEDAVTSPGAKDARIREERGAGPLYPESQLVFKDGLYFCHAHYTFRYRNKAIDEYTPNVEDNPE